jgi:hypothetical protein
LLVSVTLHNRQPHVAEGAFALLICATARALEPPLVTRDADIRAAGEGRVIG